MDYLSQNMIEHPDWFETALTDRSFKNAFQKGKDTTKPENVWPDETINADLATYGDAVLKMVLCEILFEKGSSSITEEKKRYESDRVLVSVIGKHYDILNNARFRFDKEDKNKPRDYCYPKTAGQDEPHKYIATAIEACLGALYRQTKNLSEIKNLVEMWMEWTDSVS